MRNASYVYTYAIRHASCIMHHASCIMAHGTWHMISGYIYALLRFSYERACDDGKLLICTIIFHICTYMTHNSHCTAHSACYMIKTQNNNGMENDYTATVIILTLIRSCNILPLPLHRQNSLINTMRGIQIRYACSWLGINQPHCTLTNTINTVQSYLYHLTSIAIISFSSVYVSARSIVASLSVRSSS